MNDLFRQGLIIARDLVRLKGIEALEALIAQGDMTVIETTSVRPTGETR